MVIEYYKPRAILSEKIFVGYFKVNKNINPLSEEFFRTSEPPRHNKWNPRSERLRNTYGKFTGPKHLREVLKMIRKKTEENFKYDPGDSAEIDDQLRKELFDKMLPVDLSIQKRELKRKESETIISQPVQIKIKKRRKTPAEPRTPRKKPIITKKDKMTDKKTNQPKILNEQLRKADLGRMYPLITDIERKSSLRLELIVSIPDTTDFSFSSLTISCNAVYDEDGNENDGLSLYFDDKLIPFGMLKVKEDHFPLHLEASLENLPSSLIQLIDFEASSSGFNMKREES